MRTDVVVRGAGIVGESVAGHLQQGGRAVLCVDRQAPGEGTSFGNTGLIQREAVYPYGFPRRWSEILRHGLNRSIDSHYHWGSLPRLAPFLARYWWHSGTERHAAIARKYAPLIERCVPEHLALAGEADATGLLRPGGWIKLFRTPAAMDERVRNRVRVRIKHGCASQEETLGFIQRGLDRIVRQLLRRRGVRADVIGFGSSRLLKNSMAADGWA